MAYATVADVKAYLGITSSDDDALIAALIDRAQSAIDNYTQRTFESAADTVRKFSPPADTAGATLYLYADICQITSVKTDADNPAGATIIPSSAYITQPRDTTPYYALRIVDSAYAWQYHSVPENGIEIEGRWAYSLTAPHDIVYACVRLAAYYYRQRDAQVFDVTAQPELGQLIVPQGMPADVKQLLARYVVVV